MSANLTENVKDYKFLEVINSGCFGTFYKVEHKNTETVFVWKVIDYAWLSDNKKQILMSEVEVLRSIHHPNLLRIHGCLNHRETLTLYIVLEYCNVYNLSSLINKCSAINRFVAEPFIWKVLYQISRALQFCQLKFSKICSLQCHVTPACVFLDESGNVKLGGYGLNKNFLKGNDMGVEVVQTSLQYLSPELLTGGSDNLKSNVWALGCIVQELSTLSKPLDSSSTSKLCESIRGRNRIKIPPHYTQDLQNMISIMLEPNPEQRPTADAILYHPLVVSQVALGSLQHLPSETDKKIVSEQKSVHIAERPPARKNEKLCVTCRDWEVKWEAFRQKEALIKSKEARLKEKEYFLSKREKQVALMERLTKEKLLRSEVYLKQSRRSRKSQEPVADLNDSSYSADPGDLSTLPTMSKIDPNKIIKPRFLRNITNRRSVHFDGLPFSSHAEKLPKNFYSTNMFPGKISNVTSWSDGTKSQYFRSKKRANDNKENVNKECNVSCSKSSLEGSMSLLKLNTKQMIKEF